MFDAVDKDSEYYGTIGSTLDLFLHIGGFTCGSIVG